MIDTLGYIDIYIYIYLNISIHILVNSISYMVLFLCGDLLVIIMVDIG